MKIVYQSNADALRDDLDLAGKVVEPMQFGDPGDSPGERVKKNGSLSRKCPSLTRRVVTKPAVRRRIADFIE